MSDYDRFLHAPVGLDRNGMELSVLTVLARQDLDPWDAALRLSRLGRAPAIRSLSSLLERVPTGSLPRPDIAAIASHLVSLLPAAGAALPGATTANTLPKADIAAAGLRRVQVIIGLTLVMLTLRWMLAGMATPDAAAVNTPAPPATTAAAPLSVADRTELSVRH